MGRSVFPGSATTAPLDHMARVFLALIASAVLLLIAAFVLAAFKF